LRTALAASSRFRGRLAALDPPPDLEQYQRELIELDRRDDRVWRRVVARLDRGIGFRRALRPDQEQIARSVGRADVLFKRLGLAACTLAAMLRDG
jgi:hypothetical protein